jgi:RNAse (barnase) inhibitor barstar
VDDAGQVWCTGTDVTGLFGVASEPVWRAIELLGCSPSDVLRERHQRRKPLGNVSLRMLDTAGGTLMDFFLGGAMVSRYRPAAADPVLVDVVLDVILYDTPPVAARPVLDQWRTGRPKARNLWVPYGSPGRRAWLTVARLWNSAHYGEVPDAAPGATYDLDGRYVVDEASFFCAVGEAVAGPGGYFGGGLDALNDCLCGDFGAGTPFTLVWHDYAVARRHLEPAFLGALHDLLIRRRVEVVLR